MKGNIGHSSSNNVTAAQGIKTDNRKSPRHNKAVSPVGRTSPYRAGSEKASPKHVRKAVSPKMSN